MNNKLIKLKEVLIQIEVVIAAGLEPTVVETLEYDVEDIVRAWLAMRDK